MTIAEKRAKLSATLHSLCEHVYYQTPESVKMKYPAIVYERIRINNTHADNIVYKQDILYRIVAIYTNPDDGLPEKISKIPGCLHDTSYKADNLNHDVFTVYL